MWIRKLKELGWWNYKLIYLPIAKCILECKTNSILKQGVFYDSKLILRGKNFVGQRTYLSNMELGYASYICRDCHLANTKIGAYTSIGNHVRTVMGQYPTKDFISTHPATYAVHTPMELSYVTSNTFCEHQYADPDHEWSILIGNDVWIGDDVKIVEGVSIGDGAVIGCGAVVTRDVAPYTINKGVPSKCSGKRFVDAEIEQLLQLKWWDKGEEWIREHINGKGIFHN